MVEVSTLLVVPKIDRCNAKCKFCVTSSIKKLQGYERIEEKQIDLKKLAAVSKFARQMGVVDANITGGTEPTLTSFYELRQITLNLSEYFGRVNMYTNGANLLKESNICSGPILENIALAGLTNLTISRAHYKKEKNLSVMGIDYDLSKVCEVAQNIGVDTKLSCLLMKDYIGTESEIKRYLDSAKELGIGKIIFREFLDIKTANEWTRRNYVSVEKVADLMKKEDIKEFEGLWNQRIWDYHGLGVSIWPDGKRKNTVNHGDLIYMPDNHLYSRWDTKASRIM